VVVAVDKQVVTFGKRPVHARDWRKPLLRNLQVKMVLPFGTVDSYSLIETASAKTIAFGISLPQAANEPLLGVSGGLAPPAPCQSPSAPM